MHQLPRLITGLTPAREQALQERLFIAMSNRYEGKITREISRAMRSFARNDADAVTIHEDRLKLILIRLYAESFKTFGRRLLNSIVKSQSDHETKNDIPETPQFNLARQIWIRTQSSLAVTQIAGTTEKQSLNIIRLALDESVAEGLSEIQTGRLIQSRINEEGGQLSKLRGRMIARTESHSSSNASTQMAAKSTRLPLKKQWIAAGARTRDTHLIAGQSAPVAIDQPFLVGNSLLMQPGDPSGEAKEVINCRCAVGYSL